MFICFKVMDCVWELMDRHLIFDSSELILSPSVCFSVQPRPFHCEKDLVHIAWSSSDSEQSDSETQLQSRVVPQQLIHKPARPTASSQSYTRALLMLSTSKGKTMTFCCDGACNSLQIC